MKKSIFTLLFFSVTLFAYMIPSWYPNNESSTIYSYGDGLSLEEAQNNALENIKDQLVKKGVLWSLSTITKDNLFMEKQEVLENRYFIKVSYNTLTTQEKIQKILNKQVFKTSDENNSYLIQTDFMKELYEKYGYYPHISIDINRTKYIRILDNTIYLNNADNSLFYIKYQDANITLDMKENFVSEEPYFIRVHSSYDGYLSIVQLSKEYDVVVLLENKKLLSNQEIIFPNLKESDGLIASVVNNEEIRSLTTMAIVCDEKKDFSSFNNLFSTEIIKGKLGSFIELIGSCKFTSIESTIEKNLTE